MTLHEFVEWFRRDLACKAPETWPGHIIWFLDELVRRYPDSAERAGIWPTFGGEP